MTVAVLHSYTHVLGWAYFRIGWAYFRVKGGPIFGRRVLENTPISLFEQILNSSPMGVFSRDYGTCTMFSFMCGFGLLPSCIISSLNVLETESALLLTVTALGAAQYDSEESLKGPVY